jgi:energy-converting hydrogenase Eha subunit A
LTEDSILLIIHFLLTTHSSAWPKTGAAGIAAAKKHQPLRDLKTLALVHSSFLEPVRSALYREPSLDVGPPSRAGSKCSCNSCKTSVGRSEHWTIGPVKSLAESLTLNPFLGTFVRHLPRLGDLSQSLTQLNVSPYLISRTVLSILENVPNLRSLDLPLVELRNQEDLVRAITNMKGLRRLRLAGGCAQNQDGTSRFHEGDLRRIAEACVELEELHIETKRIGFGSADGWVEGFAFKELRRLYLTGASSITDKHLKAIVSQSKKLHTLSILQSASLDLPVLPVETPVAVDAGDTKFVMPPPRLTTLGIAAVLELRGSTLKTLSINVLGQSYSTQQSSHTIPAVQSALRHCHALERLTLVGPSLILSSSLPILGSSGASTSPTRLSFGMSHLPPTNEVTTGLTRLEHLEIGLYPSSYADLLAFLLSLPPSPTFSSPFQSLKSLTITNLPACCNTYEPGSTENAESLHKAVAGKGIKLFTSGGGPWDRSGATIWSDPFAPRALAGSRMVGQMRRGPHPMNARLGPLPPGGPPGTVGQRFNADGTPAFVQLVRGRGGVWNMVVTGAPPPAAAGGPRPQRQAQLPGQGQAPVAAAPPPVVAATPDLPNQIILGQIGVPSNAQVDDEQD